VKKQVFWLRGHPTGFTFHRHSDSGILKLSSLDTAAQPHRVLTRCPILPRPIAKGTFPRSYHALRGVPKNYPTYSDCTVGSQ